MGVSLVRMLLLAAFLFIALSAKNHKIWAGARLGFQALQGSVVLNVINPVGVTPVARQGV